MKNNIVNFNPQPKFVHQILPFIPKSPLQQYFDLLGILLMEKGFTANEAAEFLKFLLDEPSDEIKQKCLDQIFGEGFFDN